MRASTVTRFTAQSVLLVFYLVAPVAARSKDPVNAAAPGNTAIHGYDPVAYFTDAKPVQGKDEFELEWMGARWRFATAEHRDAFRNAPDKYAPRYGGYCAYAVSQGHVADTDPNAWSVVDGKLYLNYSLDVQKKWKADIPGYVTKAEKNWPDVLK